MIRLIVNILNGINIAGDLTRHQLVKYLLRL